MRESIRTEVLSVALQSAAACMSREQRAAAAAMLRRRLEAVASRPLPERIEEASVELARALAVLR